MPAVDPIFIELRLRADRLERELRDVERRIGGSASRMSGAMSGLLAGVSAAGLVALGKQFLDVADKAKQLEAQLRLATAAFGTFSQAQIDVARVAASARAGLSETTSLYGSFIRTAQELGKTQAESAQATETFTKALKIGGAEPAQIASATLQMGQALASANVQWEELGAILEASPRLAKVFTDSLGVTRAELKKMAEDGKLSGEQLFDALNKSGITKQINEEFATLPVTFADAMQQVDNAAIVTFGAFDRGGEFSNIISDFVTSGADGFESLASDAEKTGIEIRAAYAGLANAFDPLLEGARAVFPAINDLARVSGNLIQGYLSGVDFVFNQAAKAVRGGAVETVGRFIPGGSVLANRLLPGTGRGTNLGGDFRDGRIRTQQRGALRMEEARVDRIFQQAVGRLPKPNELRDYLDGTGSFSGRRPPRATAAVGGRAGGRGRSGPSADTLARQAEAKRLRELRDEESFTNEKADLNDDILRARRSLATAAETIAQFELQEIENARVRQNAAYQSEVAQEKLTQVRADELIAKRNELALAQAAVVNAREAERKRAEAVQIADGSLQIARDAATVEGQLANTAKERRAAALRLLDLEYEMERARLDAILASQQSTEAEREIARRRLAALEQMQATDTAIVERQNEGALGRFRRSLNDPATDVEDAVAQKLQDVDDAIADAAAKTLGIKDPFLRRLLQIFLEQNVLKPLYDAASGGGGGLGSILQAIPALFGRASGGYVGPGQTVRVNEQRGGMELLRMGSKGGTVIPLGQASATARQAPTIVQQTFVLDARGGVTTADLIDQMNGLARQAAIEGAQGGRVLAAQDMRNANRPRI